MKAAAIVLLLAGLAGFVGLDACHAIADKQAVGPTMALLCQMSTSVAVGGTVLGLVLGIVDILRKSRRS
jgi:hypothetical protein